MADLSDDIPFGNDAGQPVAGIEHHDHIGSLT
jgi:hypothetical protein